MEPSEYMMLHIDDVADMQEEREDSEMMIEAYKGLSEELIDAVDDFLQGKLTLIELTDIKEGIKKDLANAND